MIYNKLVSKINFEVESLFSTEGIQQQVRFGSHFTNDLVMNSIHFLIPKVLIALNYINIDPVLKAGFTNSQENFYGRLAILVANLLGKLLSWSDLRWTSSAYSKCLVEQFLEHIC